MKYTAVIMAGGSGERFWPLSRQSKPKQILNLTSETKNMLQETLDRIKGFIDMEDTFVITSEILLSPIRMALPELPQENIIAEPAKRNTAPCLALAAGFIKEKYSSTHKEDEISIAVLTADHKIEPEENFQATVSYALDYVSKNEVLATIGINATEPATGYGYIETDSPFSSEEHSAKKVVSFKEKPDLETAKQYLNAGNYYWNSGMFFWRLDVFIRELSSSLPECGKEIYNIAEQYKDKTSHALSSSNQNIKSLFEAMPSESIDYGLMEKSENVVVINSNFDWDDIGSIKAIERIYSKDENNNAIKGNVTLIETKDSILINESKNILVGSFGMENVAIVVTADSILVCPKDRTDELKNLVNKIKKEGKSDWL